MSDLNNGLVLHYLLEKHDGLPVGYTRLEYIESTSAQQTITTGTPVWCINTGIVPKTNTKMEYSFMYTQYSLYTSVGRIEQSSLGAFATHCSGTSTIYVTNNAYSGLPVANTKHLIIFDNNAGTCSIDGVTRSYNKTDYSSNTLEFSLCCIRYSATQTGYWAAARYYYWKIWQDGTLVRSFVPCKNPSGTIGMYDTVNGVFYANAGSGSFTAGPEITSTKEYNISNGTTTRSNDGIKHGNITYNSSSPMYNSSTTFGGTVSDYYSTESNITCTNTTASAWIYLTSYGSSDRSTILIGYTYFTINDSGILSAYSYGKSPKGYHDLSNTAIPLNTWTHVAIKWDDSYIYGYVNGVENKKIACTGSCTWSGVCIGSEGGLYRPFNGSMSDLRVYNRALSADEIAELYAMGVK